MVGDLVYAKDELSPPTEWPLARVTEVHPGSDGSVTVSTNKSLLKRGIEKLVYLPIVEPYAQAYLAILRLVKSSDSPFPGIDLCSLAN